MMSHEHIDIGNACFVANIILNIIKPNEIPQCHLWQKIFVIILDLNTAQAYMNKNVQGDQDRNTPVPLAAPLDVNLIRRLAQNIPPAKCYYQTKREKLRTYCWCPSSTHNRASK
jgi:hypothetical protein